MSYCRFENTYSDLLKCQEELDQLGVEGKEEEANEYEKEYIKKIVALCKEIADEHGE